MIFVANRLFVNPQYAPKLEELFQERIDIVTHMPGFIKVYVLRPKNDGDPYTVLSLWDTEEHVEMWMNSEAFQEAHMREMPDDGYTAPNHVETFEVVVQADPA